MTCPYSAVRTFVFQPDPLWVALEAMSDEQIVEALSLVGIKGAEVVSRSPYIAITYKHITATIRRDGLVRSPYPLLADAIKVSPLIARQREIHREFIRAGTVVSTGYLNTGALRTTIVEPTTGLTVVLLVEINGRAKVFVEDREVSFERASAALQRVNIESVATPTSPIERHASDQVLVERIRVEI